MTPAELRELAAKVEDPREPWEDLEAAKRCVPSGCACALLWSDDGKSIASINLPNGEEPPVVIGTGLHMKNPANALYAAATRAKAWLMENANG